MNKYTIKPAYLWAKGNEIHIEAPELIYIELGDMAGCQCANDENSEKIKDKCKQVADLIREIDQLNFKR